MNNLMEKSQAAGYAGPASREKNKEVYARLVAGDEAAGDEMIQGNMPLVLLRVDAHLWRSPQLSHLREDMIGAGLLALCEAVDTMKRADAISNTTGYLYTAIDKAIGKLTDEESTIVVPQRTQEVARKDEKELHRPRTIGGNAALALSSRLHASDPLAVMELEEEILACCQDELDQRIVTMRTEGHTDAEIAAAVGLTERAVNLRRQKLHERFKERCPEYA